MSDTRMKLARTAVLKVLIEQVAAELDTSRQDILDELLQLRDAFGVKSAEVTLPDGTTVASATITQPAAKPRVVNERAFTEFVAERWPSEVETVRTVRPSWLKALMARVADAGDGTAVDTETGEIVPGVTVPPAPSPSSFSLRFTKTGRDDVVRAYREGTLGALGDLLAIGDRHNDETEAAA